MNRSKNQAPILVLFFLICLYSKAQDNSKLSGRITDCKWKSGIANATILLQSSLGLTVEAISDSLGYYNFNDSVLKPNVSYVISTRAPIVNNSSRQSFGNCPYYPCYSDKEYFNCFDKVKFNIGDTLQNKKFTYDFCLLEMLRCGWSVSPIYFTKNSINFNTERTSCSNYGSDTTFDCLVAIMKCNPSYVFELSGHADKIEKNAKALSDLRLTKVYNLLLEKGIEKERIYCQVYGDKLPAEEKDINGRVVGKLHGAINQRVEVRLLRKDYGLSNKETFPQEKKVSNEKEVGED